ncbi:hypothetical protein ACOMHN_031213 [Nucella lapillus]
MKLISPIPSQCPRPTLCEGPLAATEIIIPCIFCQSPVKSPAVTQDGLSLPQFGCVRAFITSKAVQKTASGDGWRLPNEGTSGG